MVPEKGALPLRAYNTTPVALAVKAVAALPKSLSVSIRVFGLRKGLRLPIIVSPFTIIRNIDASTVQCDIPSEQVRTGMIRIGFGNGPEGILASRQSYFGTDGKSRIVFKGSCSFSRGCTLKAVHGGVLTLGRGVECNPGTYLLCANSITIGDDFLSGWDCVIKDNDGHPVVDADVDLDTVHELVDEGKPIIIGDHVWFGAKVVVLKGARIGSNSIVGWGSLVTKQFEGEHQIIAGFPAKIIRGNANWKH